MFAGAVERDTHGLHQGLIQSGIELAGIASWRVAERWDRCGLVAYRARPAMLPRRPLTKEL